MGRHRLSSSIKMQDARAIESFMVSNQKACNRIVQNNQRMEDMLLKLATNKRAKPQIGKNLRRINRAA